MACLAFLDLGLKLVLPDRKLAISPKLYSALLRVLGLGPRVWGAQACGFWVWGSTGSDKARACGSKALILSSGVRMAGLG